MLKKITIIIKICNHFKVFCFLKNEKIKETCNSGGKVIKREE